MKIIKTLIIFVALCASQLSHAQSDMKVDTISQPSIGAQALGMEYMDNIYATPKDSLCLPRINSFGQVDSWRIRYKLQRIGRFVGIAIANRIVACIRQNDLNTVE